MVRISCPSCRTALNIDETKLPMQAVSIACPTCKVKFTVDRRELAPAAAAGGQAAPPPAAAPPAAPSPLGRAEEPDDDDDRHQLGEKALIVGVDTPALREAARVIHLQPVFFADAERARDYYLREFPQVVFFNPAQLTPPPLADAVALTAVSPADRRRGFFVLVADNLRTFDGNAAFLYGMNLILATKDLASFGQIYREAEAYHQRLYAPLNAVLAEH